MLFERCLGLCMDKRLEDSCGSGVEAVFDDGLNMDCAVPMIDTGASALM